MMSQERETEETTTSKTITRKHSNRIHTARCLLYGGSLSGVSLTERPPPRDRDPLEGTWDHRQRAPPRRSMGPGSQTGSDIIQTPRVDRMTDTSENITLPPNNKKEVIRKRHRENPIWKRHQFIHDLCRSLEFHSMAIDNKTVFGNFRNIVYICVTSFACQHQWLLPNAVENQKLKYIEKRCEGCQRRQMLSWESNSLFVPFLFLFPLIREAIHCSVRGFKSEWQYFMCTSGNWNTKHVIYFTVFFTKELHILTLIKHFLPQNADKKKARYQKLHGGLLKITSPRGNASSVKLQNSGGKLWRLKSYNYSSPLKPFIEAGLMDQSPNEAALIHWNPRK